MNPRSPTGREVKALGDLYEKHRGVWAEILKEFNQSQKQVGGRPRTLEALQKMHKRYVRRVLYEAGKRNVSLAERLRSLLEPYLVRIGQLEVRERRLTIERDKAIGERDEYKEKNEDLRARLKELEHREDPNRIALRVVRARDAMVAHSEPRR
ncbi:MAG: hypothetical protein UY60_C0010G0015 [Parcubacteria group bacterium GW2011_GWB1_50_9]|uniref:Uncharacterized protein n=1 Tax=Candidatus Adlerbacteria bacterium GW2011_GWC1_50_9 TaxID=1618608 RepID=A0A0G1WNH5_9BACT|nr:MAG: hypothetical protein UY60_C0010G0015 [Parcubacteria group bacterium GW2011_GWB1_50_9]KKW20398.1 MAG: hypothetical protein UY61_C0035G0016 [Candidatus Adlerbacteria bacterium GW2011_GWC1_50_9]